jgi:nicotinate phosphoribosyltransferase
MISRDQVSRFTDIYFSKAREACEKAGRNPRVCYQVFQRQQAVFCGMRYVRELFVGTEKEIEIHALADGDEISPGETVMHLIGPVQQLLELETVYLGLLARMTRVATNVRAVVKAANGKPVLFFPARFDAPEVQEYDGYGAMIGGAVGASTPEGAKPYNARAVGTMPHALIAAFRGDTNAAAIAFAEARPNDDIWVLVDFDNDSAQTAVNAFHALKERGFRLAGVRLDTAQGLVDKGVAAAGRNWQGVNPLLVQIVRERLDATGASEVKICVSGGFNPARIAEFERVGAKVDVYAVGEMALRGTVPFTSDVVGYYENGSLIPCAKVGRNYQPNPRLRRIQ